MEPVLKYEYYATVQRRNVEWMWYPYIPYGKLTIVQGDPGEGKSTFMLNIAALASCGHCMPDGYPLSSPITVVYQCAEDNAADTVKPRLLAAGADCNRVAYIVEDHDELTLEDTRLETVVKQTGAKLLVLDPIQSFLPQDGDMQSASRMRLILGRLADMAARQDCAVVLVGHLNKGTGGKQLYRGLGSIDIAAIARSVLLIARDKANPAIRYMQPIKSSLAPEGSALAFSFQENGSLQWSGCYEASEEKHMETVSETRRGQIARYLQDLLQIRDYSSQEILDKLAQIGVPRRTAFRVKQDLGIESYKKGTVWFWRLSNETKPTGTAKGDGA